MITRVHHVGVVVRALDAGVAFWRDALGLPLLRTADVPDQGIRAGLLGCGPCEVEVLEPTAPDSGVTRFLAKRGEGLHHLCFETEHVVREIVRLEIAGVELIDRTPRLGLAGMIAFLHPRACAGILVELATPPHREAVPEAPLATMAVHLRVDDVPAAAQTYRDLFGLAAGPASRDGSVAQVSLGGVILQFAPTRGPGAKPGLSALRLLTPELEGLAARLDGRGIGWRRGPFGIVVDPAATHGVPLIIGQPPREEDRS